MTEYIVLYFLIINIIGLSVMRVDKQRAIKHQYRISEQTLWIIAIVGGAIGAAIGMNMFRHKTKHVSFKLGFPLLAIIDLFLIFYLI